jgi:hypothetical protein
MGNYLLLLLLDKETKLKDDGIEYTEFTSLKNKKVNDAFKIMQKIYPEYKIVSIENKDKDLKIEKQLVHIYFDEVTQNVMRVEVFH